MSLNLIAPLIMTQAVLPAMRANKFGRIVNIGSRAALGKSGRTIYGGTKAGLAGMTRTWALETAADGITVNAIAPGPIATDLFLASNPPELPQTKKIAASIPVGRFGEPEEMAAAVAFLVSDDSSFMTASNFLVDGGISGAYVTPL